MRLKIFLFILLVTLSACSSPTGTNESVVRTQVAIELTQTAIAQPPPVIKVTTPTAVAATVAPTAAAAAAPTTVAPTPTVAATVANGSISGSLGFPSSGIPPLEVYALSKDDAKKFYFVKTAQNQTTFTIKDIAPGVYYVVAYTTAGANTITGGWTKAVPCGLSVDCKDNSLIPVTVKAGEETKGIEVKDWYAPPGTFPAKPSR